MELSVNKLTRGFSEWYSQEVAKHRSNGSHADDIHIDTRMSVVKECKWIMSAYDHVHSSSEIVKNGFKKAGITTVVEKGVEQPEELARVLESD